MYLFDQNLSGCSWTAINKEEVEEQIKEAEEDGCIKWVVDKRLTKPKLVKNVEHFLHLYALLFLVIIQATSLLNDAWNDKKKETK